VYATTPSDAAVYALDAETGAMLREEVPQPRTHHWLIATDGDWRLLHTRSEGSLVDTIEWWRPSSGTSIPVATVSSLEICPLCSYVTGDATWIQGTLLVTWHGGLYQVRGDGTCSFHGLDFSGQILVGSKTRGSVSPTAYWFDGEGIARFKR
jgi:hypothetical protein